MVGFLIIAHAPLASALKTVALHAFPDAAEAIEVIDVQPDMPLDEIEARAGEALARARRPEALVLTDVLGATPCNVAQRLAGSNSVSSVRVVTGVNVPMVWRALTYAHEPIDAVAARALAGGTQGVAPLTPPDPPTSANEPGDHAAQDRHHRQ